MFKILSTRSLTRSGKLFVIEAPLVARKAEPGQFVILRLDETGERIPLTIADSDPARGTVTIVFTEIGRSTIELGRLKEGDHILDLVGPLGKAVPLEGGKQVVCIGGGFGIAPLYPKAKALHDKGSSVISILGARSEDLIILEDEMRAVSHRFFVTTDDGSKGEKGVVTGPLQRLIDAGEKIDEVIAIGPPIMMKVVCELTRKYGIPTLVSLDSMMVDGTGMCGACRVTVGGERRFTCVDGPVFDGHLVDFDELIRRKRMFLQEEKKALEACPSCS